MTVVSFKNYFYRNNNSQSSKKIPLLYSVAKQTAAYILFKRPSKFILYTKHSNANTDEEIHIFLRLRLLQTKFSPTFKLSKYSQHHRRPAAIQTKENINIKKQNKKENNTKTKKTQKNSALRKNIYKNTKKNIAYSCKKIIVLAFLSIPAIEIGFLLNQNCIIFRRLVVDDRRLIPVIRHR